MSKFKVGDKVRVRLWDDMAKEYRTNKWGSLEMPNETFTIGMKEYCGKVLTVQTVSPEGRYHLKGAFGWNFTDEMFEPASETIVIYRNGNQVIALNKTTKKKGIAICSPEDKFDFYFGAELALGRLAGTKEPPKEPNTFPLYTGDVVCTRSDYRYFTKGKIYHVKNGIIKDDEGDCRIPFSTFEQLNAYFSYADFIEVIK